MWRRLVLVGLLCVAFGARAAITFQADFETGIHFDVSSTATDTFRADKSSPQNAHNFVAVGAENGITPRTGSQMLRMEIRDGDLYAGNYRNELERRNIIQYNTEFWVGYSWYFPSQYWAGDNGDHAGYVNQIKGNDGTGFIYPVMQNVDNPYVFKVCGSRRTLPWDQWVDIVMHVKIDNSNGFQTVWIDGEQICDRNPLDTDHAQGEVASGTDYMSWRFGQYFHPWTSPMRQYLDSVKFGDANSSYDEVKPGGTAPPPATYACSDNLDNDSDGLTDYPADPGCTSDTDDDEYNAPAVSCEQIAGSATMVSGTDYAPPWNPLTAGSSVWVQDTCDASEISIIVGDGGTSTYIWDQGYVWRNDVWVPITYTGDAASGATGFLSGTAQAVLPSDQYPSAGPNWHLAYICRYHNYAWRCGCQDSACTTPRWTIQYWSQ